MMRKQKIGKIIFTKVLDMPLTKYLAYIEKTTTGLTEPLVTHEFVNSKNAVQKKLFYAKIIIKDGTLCFKVLDNLLENIYSTQNCTGNKTICSLKWINTRNTFSLHVLKSLLHYQSKYWFSGKEIDLRPLTLKQFLSLYPLQYLDQTRLSRLISNLLVMNPQSQLINLRNLFISKKNITRFSLEK